MTPTYVIQIQWDIIKAKQFIHDKGLLEYRINK